MQAGLFCASSAQVCFFGFRESGGVACRVHGSWLGLRLRLRLRLRRGRMSGQVQVQVQVQARAAGSILRIHEFSILILMRHSLCCCSYEVPLVLYSYCPSNPRRGSVCRNSSSVNRNIQIHRLGGTTAHLVFSHPIPSHPTSDPIQGKHHRLRLARWQPRIHHALHTTRASSACCSPDSCLIRSRYSLVPSSYAGCLL